jgi:hypothetical protein
VISVAATIIDGAAVEIAMSGQEEMYSIFAIMRGLR